MNLWAFDPKKERNGLRYKAFRRCPGLKQSLKSSFWKIVDQKKKDFGKSTPNLATKAIRKKEPWASILK